MYINGIKSFKLNEVAPSSNESSKAVDPFEENLDGFFGASEPTEESASTQDDWIINDPLAMTVSPDGAMTTLENYPPSLEEIVAANPNAIRHLDLIVDRYEKTLEGLSALRESYINALPNVSASEAQKLQQKITLVDRAIAKSTLEHQKAISMTDSNGAIYEQERTTGKDLNGDGWIGKPENPNSLKVVYDAVGKPHYIDASGNRVGNPMLDPDYEPKVWDQEALSQISAADAIGASAEDATKADIYLKLNELQPSYSSENNKFGTPINIGVPEWIWVKRDGNSWNPKIDNETGEYVSDLAWEDGKQKIPQDKSQYVQVRVAEVETYSEEALTTTDDKKLYNTFVDLKDSEGTTILRMRIEGYYGDGPASARTSEGGYVAASSVGISFYGSNRVNPVKFDASGYESTGRHVTDDIWGKLGIDIDPDGNLAAHETQAAFEGASFTTQYGEVDGEGTTSKIQWADEAHSFNYNGGTERYTSELPGANDTLHSFRSGVFVSGLRGNITGSKFNDVIDVPAVDYRSEYAAAHLAEGAKPLGKSDPEYATVVDGGGGNNILVQKGKGDLFANNVSFAYVDATREDDVVIGVSEKTIGSNDYQPEGGNDFKTNTDPKNYVYINGAGSSTLYDFGEQQDSTHKGFFDGYNSDYYKLSGDIHASNPADPDIVGREELNQANQAGDFSELTGVMADKGKLVEDGIAGIDAEDDNFDAEAAWGNEYGYAEEQDSEMDSFFNEMFGDVNEFSTEMSGGSNQ